MKPLSKSAQRPLSDVYGRIDQVLISTPETITAKEMERQYGGIFEALGGKVQVIILGKIKDEDQRKARLVFYNEALKHQKYFPGNQVIILEPDFDDNPRAARPGEWIQDPFSILLGESDTPIFLEPYHFDDEIRSPDQDIAEQVSANTGYLIKSTRYFFAGGNLLVGDDYMLVGKDTLVKNLRHYYKNASPDTVEYEAAIRDVTREFQRIFGVDYVVWVGNDAEEKMADPCIEEGKIGFQPLFHLDLFVNLGGKTPDGDELVFVAAIDQEELNLIGTPEHLKNWQTVRTRLNEVAETLSRHHRYNSGPKFHVVRTPLGFNCIGPGQCFPLSFNNCLVEVYENVKIVYLPAYRSLEEDEGSYLRDLFERAAEGYRDNGFRVVPVSGDFLGQSEKYGSLHCMVKVLHRKFQLW